MNATLSERPEIGAIGGGRPALGADHRPRQDGGRPVLVLSTHHRRLLSAILSLAPRQSQECPTPRQLESAKATGFRPCKRCNPDGPPIEAENAALVAKACRLIEESEEEPSLEALAGAIGRSPSYFHRIFKAATGVTPKRLRRRAPRDEGSARTLLWWHRHGSDL